MQTVEALSITSTLYITVYKHQTVASVTSVRLLRGCVPASRGGPCAPPLCAVYSFTANLPG